MSAALVSVSVRLPRGGGEGGRGSEVRLAERERKREREREFRDECFMGRYHAAKNIPPESQSGIFTSIKAKQRRYYAFISFVVISAWFHYSYS